MALALKMDQKQAIENMHNGCILKGNTGTGKTRTALAYYFKINGGKIDEKTYKPMKEKPLDLYIITTAKNRDERHWESEMVPFLMGEDSQYDHKIIVDSWNNIKKYTDVQNAFFIFDEQRACGYGVWGKSFIKISKSNKWIMLSATPGDTWMDYMPVFIANGFYRNKTHFVSEHVMYRYVHNHYQVDRYFATGKLVKLRNKILIELKDQRETELHEEDVETNYDRILYKKLMKERWNVWKDKPIENISELCQCLRRVINEDESKQIKLLEIFERKPKLIIFYNYNYELKILKNLAYGNGVEIAEWNGHKHQPIPDSSKWVYLVQYTAGAEGWNCLTTDTIVFFSPNYSYKLMTQAKGRIHRLNTPFSDLYYYTFKSKSPIDRAINKALLEKENFNESKFCGW